jgi:hypothetical protein
VNLVQRNNKLNTNICLNWCYYNIRSRGLIQKLFRLSVFELVKLSEVFAKSFEVKDLTWRSKGSKGVMGLNGFGPKPQSSKSGTMIRTRQKREFQSEERGIRKLNLKCWDHLEQLDFPRSINSDSLEGIKVAKMFYKVYLKILSTQA